MWITESFSRLFNFECIYNEKVFSSGVAPCKENDHKLKFVIIGDFNIVFTLVDLILVSTYV